MLPIIPFVAAAVSSTILVSKKLHVLIKRQHKKNHHDDIREWLLHRYGTSAQIGTIHPNMFLPPENKPFLLVAFEENNIELFRKLLELGADPNTTDSAGTPILLHVLGSIFFEALVRYKPDPNRMNADGETALFFADIIETKTLLKMGADPNAHNKDGRTPLFYAETKDSIQVLTYNGANPNERDINGETPIFFVQNKPSMRTLLMRTLLESGAEPNALNNEGQTCIFKLNPCNNQDCNLATFWSTYGGDLSIKDAKNETAAIASTLQERRKHHNDSLNSQLNQAIQNQDLSMVECLLEQGANPDALDEFVPSWNMLVYAINKNNIPIFEALIRAGADVNAELEHDTPLGYAIYYYESGSGAFNSDNDKFCRILLEKGAIPNESNLKSLYYSTKRSIQNLRALFAQYPQSFTFATKDTAQMLLDAGARLATDTTILHYCVRSPMCDDETIKLLIKRGVNVNSVDPFGKTPIFYVQNSRCLKELIASGAYVNHRDYEHRTVLFYINPTETPEAAEIVKALIDAGIDVNAKDKNGQNAPITKEIPRLLDQIPFNELLNKAVDDNNVEGVKHALKNHANPRRRHRFQSKWNMLMLAIYRDNPAILSLLLQYGADPNESINGNTAITVAERRHNHCTSILKKYQIKD